MTDFWTEVLQFAETTTERVAEKLIGDFGKLQAIRKPDGSLVTQADKWADQEIRRSIAAKFPYHGALTEETEHIFPDKDWCWIVDPIDGTTNFTRGIGIWGICLGLLYRGTPIFGYIRFPLINECFYGYWGGNSGLTPPEGAYRNGERIYTSQDQPSYNHLFTLCARSTHLIPLPFPCKVRLIGVASYNLVLVACGASLGAMEATPRVWDIAAGWAILKAAGGVFVNLASEDLFPLKVEQDYGSFPCPCLIASREELVPIFKKPL
jgi:myo-inositol-1(or 4)-monophosphatase